MCTHHIPPLRGSVEVFPSAPTPQSGTVEGPCPTASKDFGQVSRNMAIFPIWGALSAFICPPTGIALVWFIKRLARDTYPDTKDPLEKEFRQHCLKTANRTFAAACLGGMLLAGVNMSDDHKIQALDFIINPVVAKQLRDNISATEEVVGNMFRAPENRTWSDIGQ